MKSKRQELLERADALAEAARVAALQEEITAEVARGRATVFLIFNVGNLLHGETPDFRDGERPCWSVPVVLTSPSRGPIGAVGEVLVDAATGEVLADAEIRARLAREARRLAMASGGVEAS